MKAGATFGGAGTATVTRFDVNQEAGATSTLQVGNGTDAISTLALNGTTDQGSPNSITNAQLTFNLDTSSTSSNVLNIGTSTLGFNGDVTLQLNLQGVGTIVPHTIYTLIVGSMPSGGGGWFDSQFQGITTTTNDRGEEQITSGLDYQLTGSSAAAYQGQSYLILVQQPGFDAIQIEIVPEPETWAMMLGGIGLLLAVQRRRNSRSRA